MTCYLWKVLALNRDRLHITLFVRLLNFGRLSYDLRGALHTLAQFKILDLNCWSFLTFLHAEEVERHLLWNHIKISKEKYSWITLSQPGGGGVGAHCAPPPHVHFLNNLNNTIATDLKFSENLNELKFHDKRIFFNRLRPALASIATSKVDACFWKTHFSSFNAKEIATSEARQGQVIVDAVSFEHSSVCGLYRVRVTNSAPYRVVVGVVRSLRNCPRTGYMWYPVAVPSPMAVHGLLSCPNKKTVIGPWTAIADGRTAIRGSGFNSL